MSFRQTFLRTSAAGAVALAALGATACGDDESAPAAAAPAVRVVASTTHLADLARQVGGDRVRVVSLLQPGSDPHAYEPRPGDVREVAEADVVLVSGLGLDDWAREVAREAGGRAQVVDVGARVPVEHRAEEEHGEEEHGEEEHADEEGHAGEEEHAGEEGHAGEEEHDHGEVDPHWWQDARNLEAAAQHIATVLGRRAPGVSAAGFAARVRDLDRRARACFARVPRAQRKLVTDHDAFRLFAQRYGLEVVGAVIPSRSSQAQPSARDLAELAHVIEEEGVRAVFPESQLRPRLAQAIARRTGVAVDFRLFSDALGPAGSDGATVLGALAHNVREVVRGLSGGRERCDV